MKQGGGGTGGTGGTGGGGTTDTEPTTPQNSLSIPGWTHIAVATNNVVFFYNSTNGHGATARLNPDGSLTVLQKFPDPAKGNAAFDRGAAIITAGPNNSLLSYWRDSPTSLCVMGDGGLIGQCNHFTFAKYWTDISIDRQTGMAWLYSGTEGVRNLAKIDAGSAIGTYS